jgi:hypothetical protein
MPEWLKILISAGTGALLGIVSNIGMEFVKPMIAQAVGRRRILNHLDEEFRGNYGAFLAVRKLTGSMRSCLRT